MGLLRWLDFRGRRYERIKRNVAALIEQGDHVSAKAALLAAMKAWSINWENGSRASILRDYAFLLWLIEQIEAVASSDAMLTDNCRTIKTTAQQLHDLFNNRENFGVDGRTMRTQVAGEYVRLQDQLKQQMAKLPS